MARHIRGTGRVFRRKGSPFWWLSYYHAGKEVRQSSGIVATADETERPKVERMLRERTRKAGTSEFIGPAEQRVRFTELAEVYLRDYRVNGKRSLRDAERIVERLRGTFGSDRAIDITTARIERYTDARLVDGAAKATINRELAALRRMFTLATRRKDGVRLTTRPHIDMLDESDNARQGFLEPEDFEALRGQLPIDVADSARFAYHSAWRRGEVLGLEWKDVHLDRRDGVIVGGTIRLPATRTKNKRGRVLVLRAELLDAIRDRYARRRLDCPLVFHRGGQPIRDFRAAWETACDKAKLPGVLFHDLRRSAVRNLVRAGVSQTVAMAISGHKTASVFRRYDITNEADIAAALDLTAADVARKRERTRQVTALPENADTSRTLSA
jgi:integrase